MVFLSLSSTLGGCDSEEELSFKLISHNGEYEIWPNLLEPAVPSRFMRFRATVLTQLNVFARPKLRSLPFNVYTGTATPLTRLK
jgi:hypothetical protein